MPTKRRVIIFLVVLSVMLFAKYMWGQDSAEAVGWDSINDGANDGILAVVVGGPLLGVFVGLIKVSARNLAARSGVLFNSEMVRLRL